MSELGAVAIARILGLPQPTPEQVAVIEAPLEPVLVVAGAGSGKTETMTSRVVHLVANNLVERDRVLGLTFTRKAAGELSDRVRRRLRALDLALGRRDGTGVLVAPTIATYNAYAAGIVGEHALRLGIEPSARLLGEAGRWQLAHDIVEHWSADLDVDLATATVTEAVLGLAGALAEHLVEPDQVRSFTQQWVRTVATLPSGTKRGVPKPVAEARDSLALRGRLMDMVEEFAARKRQADLMDFADQVALAARLAREVHDVGDAERSRYAVVLLDEYQDTSVAQLTLLRHLFGDRAGDGVGHPVTAVGDPHQSIYGWRGASAGGLEQFPVHFPADDGRPARVLDLATSWRNDVAVLAAANTVAGPLRQAVSARDHLSLLELGPRPDAGAGEVCVAVTETIEDEARTVAAFIAERRRARQGGTRPATAAVLCRRRAQFALLHTALLDAGLPVEVVGLGGLLSTPEVVDIVAALEATHDPSRGDSLMRLLTGPRAQLGLADLHALADWSAELAEQADERSIVDGLDELPPHGWVSRRGRRFSERGRERLADLACVLRGLRGQTYLPLVDLVAAAERVLGLDIEVAARPGRSAAAARAHLDAFRSVAADFDTTEGGTLGGFLAWLAAAAREERGLEMPVAEMDPAAVQLLTVHAAKGLEWDVVAVPGLVERTFPVAVRSGWVTDRCALPTALRGDKDHLPDVEIDDAPDLAEIAHRLADLKDAHADHHKAEERRLAYVALTRARSHLLLAASRWRDGVKPTPLSSFLTEVLESADLGGHPIPRVCWAQDPAVPGPDGQPPVRPASEVLPSAPWPPERALGERQICVERAADAVRAAMSAADKGRVRAETASGAVEVAPGEREGPPDSHGARREPRERHPDGHGARREHREGPPGGGDLFAVADLLLDEHRRRDVDRSGVAMPSHLSASAVVRLAADPKAFALQLRRPVPIEPSTQARRGTAFHAWVEEYYGSAALLDVDALPGADDETIEDDVDLAALQATFLASPWAGRSPIAVEVDVETPVGGIVLRSRIDAVFAEPDGRVVVVDWKTGRPPVDPVVTRSRELQLVAYRLAWSRRRGIPPESVSAAFFYVTTGETVYSTTDIGLIGQTLAQAVGGAGQALPGL